MGYWNTRGLRGSELEEMLNATHELYKREGLALVQKIPTPITPVEIDKKTRTIRLGYFGEKSTVDYIGVIQGVPVCFDAKETNQTNFPLSNIHKHQIEYMKNFAAQKGLSFIILYYKKAEKCFIVTMDKLDEILVKLNEKGKKSISISDLDESMEVDIVKNVYVNYLNKLNDYI